MKNNNNIKTVVAIGIGAALFFVLGRFVAIPSPVPNTNISLQYAVLGLLAAMYGPVAGCLIGFIGHTLIDLSWGGSPWWSWVIASAVVGIVVGLFAKKIQVQEGDFGKGKVVIFTIANVIAHIQCNYRYCSWWTSDSGVYQDNCKEGFSGSGIIEQKILKRNMQKALLRFIFIINLNYGYKPAAGLFHMYCKRSLVY